MAIDNLNYMVSGLPAGQQTDKYSTNPGCIKSKNLDIFSSSKSVKATAWSEGVSIVNDYVDIDERGNLRLKSDCKVYNSNGTVVYDPTTDYVSQQVSYTGEIGPYSASTIGTPLKLFVRYVGDEWVALTIFTTTTQIIYNKNGRTLSKVWSINDNTCEYIGLEDNGYHFKGKGSTQYHSYNYSINIDINSSTFCKVPIKIKAGCPGTRKIDIYYKDIKGLYISKKDGFMVSRGDKDTEETIHYEAEQDLDLNVSIPVHPGNNTIRIVFSMQSESYQYPSFMNLYVDVNGGCNLDENDTHEGHTVAGTTGDYLSDYTFLINKNRVITPLGNYGFEKDTNIQTLYKWGYTWEAESNVSWMYGIYGQWETDPAMDINTCVVWNTDPYIIGNYNLSGYIIPAPIGGDTETPYIAEGVKFLNAVPIDYYMYLVGEERGVSGLYVYSGQQLVKLLSGTEIKSENDLVDNTEQFRFDGTMCNYRGRIVLGTEDGRVFMYGKTTNGNGGAFIHETGGDITDIKVENDKLVVYYTKNSVKYKTTFQDAIHSKNYNTEWEAEYPITIGNHILEKEEADLYASYILCKNNSLEFRASANHYQYWSFKGDADITIGDGREVKVGCWSGDYKLTFVEKNGLRYTFKLEGDLPVQTVGDKEIKKVDGTHLINYTEYNNFRRIGIVESDKFIEDKIRFHNINNLLDLPNSHSIQIMVRGKGTANHSPELFSVDLVANQRERG